MGVQAPAGFLDPLGFVAKDGPEAFVRRRAVERKHGRISMVAITGVLVHNAQIEFPGYLSKSADLKFSDVREAAPNFRATPSGRVPFGGLGRGAAAGARRGHSEGRQGRRSTAFDERRGRARRPHDDREEGLAGCAWARS